PGKAAAYGSWPAPGRQGGCCTTSSTSSRRYLLRRCRRRLSLAQFVARQLADRGARQFLDELDGRWQLVLAELAGEEGAEFIDGERRRARAQRDEGFGRLAAVIVGNADHDHLEHGRVGVDRLLDHLRIDVEAAGDDHVLLAVDQEKVAVVIAVADVAGQEAVADKGLRGFLGPVPVSLGDVRAADADLADLAIRK